ncbi:MAG: LON peptidase substrate-binding domain-containing protein, partial [Thermodesulfobacteriota bacterium]
TVVFFPNTLLPLHIFEQRYRDMLTDSLNSEKIIAMALLKQGWEKSYYENPEIYDVAGMGRIVSSETFNDGRSNIVLYGLKRIKIVEVLEDKPYRKAKVEILEDLKSQSVQNYREKINRLISGWNNMLGDREKDHKISINTMLPLENLTDVLASVLISNVVEKQLLLQETDVEIRARKLIAFLETRLKVISVTYGRADSILEKRNLN